MGPGWERRHCPGWVGSFLWGGEGDGKEQYSQNRGSPLSLLGPRAWGTEKMVKLSG